MSEIAPCGLHELGLAEAESSPPPVRPPIGILVDAIDPATGEIASMVDARHPVDQNIILAFRVVFGSGVAVSTIGHRFRDIRKVTDSTARALAGEARRVLAPFVAKRQIRIDAVMTEAPTLAGGDSGGVLVVYTNLITGQRDRRVRTLS